MKKQITLNIKNTKIDKMIFIDASDDTKIFGDFLDSNISLDYQVIYNEKKSFCVSFSIAIKAFYKILHCEYHAFFDVDFEIDEDFKESNFPKVNAPAIAYPFLRAFIINFLINAGYSKIDMPSINFQKMTKKAKSKNLVK